MVKRRILQYASKNVQLSRYTKFKSEIIRRAK